MVAFGTLVSLHLGLLVVPSVCLRTFIATYWAGSRMGGGAHHEWPPRLIIHIKANKESAEKPTRLLICRHINVNYKVTGRIYLYVVASRSR